MAASINRSVISIIQNTPYLYVVLFAHLLDQVSPSSLPRQFQCTSIYSSYTYDKCQAKFLDAACWQGLEGDGLIGDCPSICNNVVSDSDEGRCRDNCKDYYSTCSWVVVTTPHISTAAAPAGSRIPNPDLVISPILAGLVIVVIFVAVFCCRKKKKLCFKRPSQDDEKLDKKPGEKGGGSNNGENKAQTSRTSSTASLVPKSVEASPEHVKDSAAPGPTGSDNLPFADDPPSDLITINENEDTGHRCTGTNDRDDMPNEVNIDGFTPVTDDQAVQPKPPATSQTGNESGYSTANISNSSSICPLADQSSPTGSNVGTEESINNNDSDAASGVFSWDGLGVPGTDNSQSQQTVLLEGVAKRVQDMNGRPALQLQGLKIDSPGNPEYNDPSAPENNS